MKGTETGAKCSQLRREGSTQNVHAEHGEYAGAHISARISETDNTQSILDGTYRPNPVRRVEIPKENGNKINLGIPTVVDRVIQQAIAQVLTPIYEKQFSENSFGFRPKRSAYGEIRRSTSM